MKTHKSFAKTRFIEPYRSNGRTTFPETAGKSGVYLIKEDAEIVYVGYSTKSLYKTMYRHFQQWNHRKQDVVTYANEMNRRRYTVRIVLCSPAKAERLERALIIKYQPRDNAMKYEAYRYTRADVIIVDTYEQLDVIALADVPF